MIDNQLIKIKPSILHKQIEINFADDFIQYFNIKNGTISILKENIDGFRYGVKWIRGYAFTIGRIYCIDIKSGDIVIQLRIKSLYGIRKKQIFNKYALIIKILFSKYFSENVNQLLSIYNAGADIEIEGVIFSKNHIYFPKNKINVIWENVGTKDYHTYFALYNKINPKIHETFYYLTDWNVYVIHFVSRHILQQKGLLVI